MAAVEGAAPIDLSGGVRSILKQLREEMIPTVLPFVVVVGLAVAMTEEAIPDALQYVSPGLVLLACAFVAWALRQVKPLASAWVLVLGCLLANIEYALAANAAPALCLLALPVGLAVVLIGIPAGAFVATGITLFLLRAPAPLVALAGGLRVAVALEIWGIVVLIWLAQRPLMTAVQWSWSSYEQNRQLLEQTRDFHGQYKQMLADLTDANLQLTRLNDLAKQLQRSAEEARVAKEQFVANVSHELRTPLNMIIGFSEMILRAPEVYGGHIPPALLADLTVILRNSQHLADLVNDVLDLSQIEARQMALSKEWVSLREIVEAAVAAVRPLFESKGLYLNVEMMEEDILAFCDRTRIREVFLNLLSNAGRFTERGGVKVRVSRQGGDVVASISDTGPGIAPEDAQKLFQPFYQIDGSLRRRHGGSGLGLAISKSFVELHGGRMWLESEVNSGTTVFFRLPVEPPAPVSTSAVRWLNPNWEFEQRTRKSLAPAPVVRPRLVVLESGGSLAHLLRRYLSNVEIVHVTSLEQAFCELSRVPTQALLVNAASVSETLQRLSTSVALPYGTPAIVCSVPGPYEAAGALGVSDYLIKPVKWETLQAVLDRLEMDGKTILIVDDEPDARRLFWRMLATAGRGYKVLTASDGRQAETILREQRPDALLLDLVMPGMDGFRLLEIKKADPMLRDIPVVVVTGRDPAGYPIVSKALAVTRGGGLSVPQILSLIESITGIAPAQQERCLLVQSAQ